MKEELIEKIKAEREVIETMPVNNKKNIKLYNEKISDLKEEYGILREEVLNEISKRFEKKTRESDKKEIENIKKQIDNYSDIMNIINEKVGPYEKSGLNKEVYRLSRYYKENLENVNNQIFVCINILRNMGIDISVDDFDISEYAREYMEVFLSEMKVGDINSDQIKTKFENIYWKCPDLIAHIEVNIEMLYMKNINNINKFYEKKKQDAIEKYKIDEKTIIEQSNIAKKDLINLELINRNNIIDKFLNGKLNERDYTEEKVATYYNKILDKEYFKNIQKDDENLKELDENILKFINSVYEYKKFLEFRYILDDINKILKEKDKYKTLYKENLKDIKVSETKLRKLNKPSIFGKKETKDGEINEIIMDLRVKYKNLTKNIIYERLTRNLTEESTIYDALMLASNYYEFLVECIINYDNSVEQKDIDRIIDDFQDFIKFPYFTILNNIGVNQKKDIALIIKDRYKLLNFNISKEDLSENNISNILNNLEKIRNNYAIKKSGLNIQEINNICQLKKILNESNN